MPRFSAPLSFLSLRAFAFALVIIGMALVAPSAASITVNPNCVCNYDPTKDYFPVKLTPQYAVNYAIEYNKSYKKITVQTPSGPVVTYAYLCGTPQPPGAIANNSIQIPIASVGLTSTTFLPLVNYIGRSATVVYIAAEETDLPSCLRKMTLEGKVEADFNITFVAPEVISTSVGMTGHYPDVIFSDSWDYLSTLDAVKSNFGTYTHVFQIPQSTEKTALGALEWLEVVAALYNKEVQAKYVMESINARYNCVKNLIAANPPLVRKKVAWGYYYQSYDSFYFGTCPNYYCQLIADAGGDIIPATSLSQTLEETVALVAQVDVWIYPDGNWNESTEFDGPFFVGNNAVAFANTTVIKTKQVFDYLGGHSLDWFDTRLAEPDVLLMDLVQALYGSQYISSVRQKAFLRNVFTEPEASQAPRDPAHCVDENAILYTDWLSGPCYSTGTVDTGLEQALCTKKSDANIVRASWLVSAAFMTLVYGMA